MSASGLVTYRACAVHCDLIPREFHKAGPLVRRVSEQIYLLDLATGAGLRLVVSSKTEVVKTLAICNVARCTFKRNAEPSTAMKR